MRPFVGDPAAAASGDRRRGLLGLGGEGGPRPAAATRGPTISTRPWALAFVALRVGKSLLAGLGGSSGEEATSVSPFRFLFGEAVPLLLTFELILE